MSNRRVLVIGGYGVFGSMIASRLARDGGIDVVVAGRSRQKARVHCGRHGGRPLQLDTSGDLLAVFQSARPDIVIDASGPFQSRAAEPYRVARAAIAARAHYIDLADDASFVRGIEALDDDARAAGVMVLSGCSTVPAVSAAAVDHLRNGIAKIESIETCLLPGNRAPRGVSVIKSILAQVGRPLRVREAGRWRERIAWRATERHRLTVEGMPPMGLRRASLIGAPDLILFPQRYGARTVRFLAGLELAVMHLGVRWLSELVHRKLIKNPAGFARLLKSLADVFYPFGSDRGGMAVRVTGRRSDGSAIEKTWTVVAEAGDGPQIPAIPAYVLARRLLEGHVIPGARPCVGEVSLADIEMAMHPLAIRTGVRETPIVPLFNQALGGELETLPPEIVRLHDIIDRDVFEGRASVVRGGHPLARVVCWLFGFPPASEDVGVTVEMVRAGDGEYWTRSFGNKVFHSHLTRRAGDRPGDVWERFGPFSFRLPLRADGGALSYPVAEGQFPGGISIPRMMLPKSDSREYVDDKGRACFDVALSMPWIGRLVRYRGWLRPVDAGSVEGCGPGAP
jgi:NAD(P)-dependent dehydrogenase (short-subunit alcohol dehydrogenase family)